MTQNKLCGHPHGDNVAHLMGWVCGVCFEILGERPKKYKMVGLKVPSDWDGKVYAGPRQEISWQAEVLKSKEGTTLSVFIRAVARRMQHRSDLDLDTAYAAALDSIKGMGVPFGDPDYDWCRLSAIDVADEEMTYWDHDESCGNG